jgi:uroporphyrinogen-III synthase
MTDAPRSLIGRRILVTRAAAQSEALREALATRGAAVIACPVLRMEAALAPADLPSLDRYRWLVFTSRNAVGFVRELLAGADLPPDARIAVVGPGTAAALATLGREPDLVAEPATGVGLAAAFRTRGLPAGTLVLRIRGDLAPPDVEQELERLGAVVDVLTAYRTLTIPPPEAARDAITAGGIDAVTFYSPSAVRGLDEGVPGHRLKEAALAACVGPVTAAAATEAGWRRVITADQPAAPALAAALAAALTPNSRNPR